METLAKGGQRDNDGMISVCLCRDALTVAVEDVLYQLQPFQFKLQLPLTLLGMSFLGAENHLPSLFQCLCHIAYLLLRSV